MIPLVKTRLPDKVQMMSELENILYSGYIAQGEKVDEFERLFQEYVGKGYSVSLNSGTAALHIALILAGVTKGSEVISTALTAEPTNIAIKMVGANIRYADIDYDTGCISPVSIESRINPLTKAIVAVDYAGVPVNVPELKKISEKYKLPIIHDAAHSFGSSFMSENVGSYFPYTIFSFQAIKHITTIDGGMLQMLDEVDYEKAKLIRWFGIDKKKSRLDNDISIQGYKYHMNNVNATIGILQMREAEKLVNAYMKNGFFFDNELKNVKGVELLKYYPDSRPSYWLYTIKVENREGLIKKLAEKNIQASELHKRNDLHNYLNDFNCELPILDMFYPKMLHLPCGWWLTDEDINLIVNTIKSGW